MSSHIDVNVYVQKDLFWSVWKITLWIILLIAAILWIMVCELIIGQSVVRVLRPLL